MVICKTVVRNYKEILSGGYDADLFVEAPDDELLCAICHGVLRCAVVISCSHIFCKKCIQQWLKRQLTCPICRNEVRERLMVVVHRLNRRINRLEVKCPHEQQGCFLTFPVAQLDEHSSSCDYALLECSNNGCSAIVLRRDLELHQDICQYWQQLCRMGCGTMLTLQNRDHHNCYLQLKQKWDRKTEETRRMVVRLKKKSRRLQNLSAQISRHIHLICESLDIPYSSEASPNNASG